MRIAVLGAGVIGLTTAHLLAEDGHEVSVIDRRNAPGLETSFANGAQLSYAYVAPLASPSTLLKLPGLMLAKDSPIRVRPSFDADFLRWGLSFLAACLPGREQATIAAQLALAALSREGTMRLADQLALEFGLAENGKLVIFRSSKSFASARTHAEQLAQLGVPQKVLSGPECLTEEPMLRMISGTIAGGILTPTEQVGDCARFCAGLARRLGQRNSVRMLMDTAVTGGIVRDNRLVAVTTSLGEVEADLFVLAMASESASFARGLGLRLPIYPMKGYSITVRPKAGDRLIHSITDADAKVVFAPLTEGVEQSIRIAGIADLVGRDPQPDPSRVRSLVETAARTMQFVPEPKQAAWAGLRPATPDSRPIIGWTPVQGLFLNTGHGALGWTLAAGSAMLSADLIAGRLPSIDPAPFALDRGRRRS